MLFWCETVAMAPHRFDDVGAKLAAELIDHAGDPRPTGVKGVRGDSFIDLAGSEHLPRPAGQQEQNVELHRRQIHHLAGLPYQPAMRVDLQGAKEQRRVCGGSHRGKICNRRKSGDCFIKDNIIVIIKRQDYQLPKRITSLYLEPRYNHFPILQSAFS